ncbi:hypothetical protein PHISP_06719 [Aspergillus sp. HF37]|nr:hypothetical protein PHISP_06719 [Aspergillus sp. HF37]
MRLTPICAILSIAVAGAYASPWGGWHPDEPEKPEKPEKPTVHKTQSNVCGNGVQPYCCNNEAFYGGNVDCRPLSQSDVCSTTIVCCNSQDSISTCIGNVNIDRDAWGWW